MKSILILLLVIFPFLGLSWNAEGHRYTAIIAYKLLPDDVRQKVIEDLKAHHMFDAHFFTEMPKEVKESSDEIQNIWLFSQMAVWPDHIKNRALEYSPVWRKWHYINLPILLTDIDKRYYKNNVPINTERNYSGEPSDDWNISQAYKYNSDVIDDASGSQKAISLCWIFHLTGDVHQPLHTSALFNEGRFIKGDMGGNAIFVKGIGTLHTYWDGATATKGNKKWSFNDHISHCEDLLKKFISEGEKAKQDMEIESWINESHEIAVVTGYPQMMLDLIKESSKEQYGFKNPLKLKLAKTILNKWKLEIKQTSNLRVTLAGYRLAEFLIRKYN